MYNAAGVVANINSVHWKVSRVAKSKQNHLGQVQENRHRISKGNKLQQWIQSVKNIYIGPEQMKSLYSLSDALEYFLPIKRDNQFKMGWVSRPLNSQLS